MTLAILLSGQGAQDPGMFDLTADHPAAGPVFDAAAEWLDEDPRALVRRPEADLHANRTGQILCVTSALAAWAAIRDAVPERAIVSGYSIGDLAAWGVAGRIDAPTILRLTARRAEEMDRAAGADQGLAGIRGIPLDRIAELCAEHRAHIAIRNAADSAVVGGGRAALAELCSAALAAGAARAVALDVRVPSHTPALAGATRALLPVFREAPVLRQPAGAPRLIAGLDGGTVFSAGEGLDKLARQVSETIDWAACLSACAEFGATAYLELGPGHALARMAEGAAPGARVRALEDFRSLEGVRDWIARSGRPAT